MIVAPKGSTIVEWLRRAILTIAQSASQLNRDVTPEFYRFPPF